MPRQKGADRAGLHAGCWPWPGGVVRRRGRSVPGRAAPGQPLATTRPAHHAAARICPRRHEQDPDLFHPATGQVYLQSVTSCTNSVLHGWLKKELTAILARLPIPSEPVDAAATRAAWQVWQDGLADPFTLPEQLPSLRLLLVWDNLAGHKSTEMVMWLCQHGIMPLSTPLGGSWLNMAESIQRILKRRALAGQHPQSPAEIGTWFEQTAEAWNRQPTPLALMALIVDMARIR